MRDASYSMDRYVCECEGWVPLTREEKLEAALLTLILAVEHLCDEEGDAAFAEAKKVLRNKDE